MKLWSKMMHAARAAWTIAIHHPKALFLAGIIIGSLIGHTVSVLVTEASYRLSNGSVQLIGDANPALADKLKLDKNIGAYRFNADAITPEMTGESDPTKVAALLASQNKQTGGGSKDSKNLYSLDLPVDPSQGTKVYDINSKTSFKLTPEFEMGAGRTEEGRVVYPIDEGGQAVYTVKANGIKEDIILQKPRGDQLSFQYKLDLPKTLEARLDERGNLGIYGVNPAVSSAVAGALQNGASSTDTERLKDVQENGTKDYLVYMIPAPTIVQSGDKSKQHAARAIYKLNGDLLMVEAAGLEKLVYPISIDPSVVVTSTNDFATGNNEGMIQFDTDAISRGAPTAGTIGAWANTASFTNTRSLHSSVAYNGYLYVIGADSATTNKGVEYAPINADGTVGAWVSTTSLPVGKYYNDAVAYSGYLYVLAGSSGSTSYSTDVSYARINTDGTLGGWANTTSLSVGRQAPAAVAYNGYVYVVSGQSGGSSYTATIEYARINADGTLGVWSTTTSLATGVSQHCSVVYDGKLYVIGGYNSGLYFGTVQYASINSDGSVGAWTATTSLPASSFNDTALINGGYLYVLGSSPSRYALINADGSIGAWATTATSSTSRSSETIVDYKGYVYVMGGTVSGSPSNTVEFAKFDPSMPDPTMTMPAWATTTTLGVSGGGAATVGATRRSHASVAYRGVLYVIGGLVSTTGVGTVHYATINPNGTLGAWAATSGLSAARNNHSAAMNNHYMYVTGGRDNSSVYTTTVSYTSVNATTGTLATWASTTAMPAGRSNHTTVIHDNYIYVVGGLTTGGAKVDTVYYAPLSATGTVGTWNTTTVLPAARDSHQSIVYNNYLYVIGGNTGSAVASVVYAPINSNGTIGTWTTAANSMSSARELFSAVMYAGHIVALGGYSGSALLATTEFSKINADGSLGTWTAGASFTTAREGHAAAVFNGVIVLSGGWNRATTYYGDTQYTSATYKRSGILANYGTVNAWQTTTSTNLAVLGHASVVYGNYIYMVGGMSASGVYRNDIRYASINEDGTIGTWTTSPNVMGLARFNGGAVAYNGYLYAIGGQQGSGVVTNTVEYAQINSDGSIGAWTTSANTFTTARHGHITAIYNGKLYVVGGGDSADAALSDVKYASINSDGTVGAWADTTATVPTLDADGFVYGGRIYTVGGRNGANYYATVKYAPINTDGTIGVWRTSSELMSAARSRIAAVALNGYIYYSGGTQVVGSTASTSSSTFYAPIMADGSIGHWQATNGISTAGDGTTAINYQSAVAYKGRIYSLGGTAGTSSPYTPKAESYMMTVNTPALSGVYTQRINLGQLSTLNSITTNGFMLPDQATVLFRTAGVDGIYSNWQSPSVLSAAPIDGVQFVMYKISFDDSQGSAYSTTTNASSATDIAVDYTPLPMLTTENRLRQNKYFDGGGVLQPLQTQ